MLEFIPGPNGERITLKDQKHIRECLSPNSFSYHVNYYYNNNHHFSAPYTYDIEPFLKEIQRIIESTTHTLQIMGGIHTDPYGHTTHRLADCSEGVCATTVLLVVQVDPVLALVPAQNRSVASRISRLIFTSWYCTIPYPSFRSI